MIRSASRRRFRQRLLVVFLLLMLVGYARQLVTSPTAGQDFRVFFAAASLLADGGNPYDWQALGAKEDSLYNAPGQLRPGDSAYYEFLAFPEGPWLALALVPVTQWPWPFAYAAFAALMAFAIGAGAWMILTLSKWSGWLRTVALVCVLLSPVAFINLFFGQVSPLIFCAFALAWALVARGRPTAAGLVLTLVWLKPNIGLVLPAVVALLEPAAARRLLGAFAAGTAAAFGIAALALGGRLIGWPLEIPRFWQAVQGPQPDFASVHSFYYPGLHGWPKTAALLVVLAAAGAYARWAFRRDTGANARGLTLLLVWLGALPFVQSYDMILLLPSVVWLLGSGLEGWADVRLELMLWALLLFPLGYLIGLRLGYFNGFSAIPVALLAFAWHTRVLNPGKRARVGMAA